MINYLWISPVFMCIWLLLGKQYKLETAFQVHITNAIRATIWLGLGIALMFRFS